MSIASLDALAQALTAGQSFNRPWNKITGAAAYTAGRWYDMSALGGSPVANAWAGTALTWKTCDELTGNGTQIFGMQHGGNVAAMTKHLTSISGAATAATGVPSTLLLVDIQGYYPSISMNTLSAQTLLGTPAFRYTNGEGCLPYLVTTATTGATAHNFAMSYTNVAGTAGRSLGQTVACTASSIVPHLTHTGVAANNYGPFLPLEGGDTGVRSVQSVTLSAASGAGTAALVLARPLFEVPLAVTGLLAERDLLHGTPSLETIKDGACLAWLLQANAATAASTTFYGFTKGFWA